MNSLAVRADGRDLRRLQTGLPHGSQRSVGKLFAKEKIQFADFVDGAVEAVVQDPPAERGRECVVDMRKQLCTQVPTAPGNLGHYRINPIG